MEAPVSASLGVVRSLPAKLEQLLSPEAEAEDRLRLREAERNKIRLLKDLLQELAHKYLEPLEEVEAPAATTRCWMKEVRELSYDIDDFLHELINGHHANPKNREGRSRSRRIADQCSQFRARLRDAIRRHKDYNLGRWVILTSRIASEERPLAPLYDLATAPLVGIDGPMEKLQEWLIGDGGRNLRLVSIVGFGGVGKTTLVKELYRKMESQFECMAFARTSQKPNIRKLLTSILLQVRPERPPDANAESSNLIDTIRAHLQHKKYIIIIDDLWASSTWDIVCRAFPDNRCCSRVVTTTEIDVVARRCCGLNSEYIFKMRPLREDDARTLFFSRFPNDQSGSCDQSVLVDIVRKCGGFPLATAIISSLLARSLIEQCNNIRRSLSSNLRTNPSMEGMKQILNLCYNNLPCRLKACMLYISIYKEDHIIWKDDLVKQWIAEGFICAKEGENMEEVASAYFDELVSRGLIQPEDINCSGEVLSCTVHYMILNLIRYKSVEENFVTAIDCTQTNIRLADKVRRLSLLFGDEDDAEQPANLRLSNIRSLVFDGLFNCLPSIVEFRHLRVLILHIWSDQDNISFDLTTLRELSGLRYLQVVCDVTLNLRTDMHGLKYLETLKIDSRVMEVPQDITHLPGLLHLTLPGGTSLPDGIEQLATLQTFGFFDLSSNSPETVRSLGELTNIWDLRLTCSERQSYNLKNNMDQLSSVMSNLRNLKSLTLLASGTLKENTLEARTASSTDISFDLNKVSSPPIRLEKLEIMPRICILSVLPHWIGELRLLSILKIEVMGLSGGDIGILKGLPALAALSLYVRTAPAERIIFHKDGFLILKHLMFSCPALCVVFARGAMPNVRRLKLGFNANTIGECSIVEAGFENLAVLELLSAQIGGAEFCAHEFSRKSVQSALEDTFRQSSCPPVVHVQLVDWAFYSHMEIGTSSAAQQQTTEEPSTEDIITLLPDEGDDPDPDLHQRPDLHLRQRTPRPPSPPPSRPTRPDAQPWPHHRRPRGCGGSMLLGPLSSGCGGVLSTSKSEGRDGLLWWHGLAPCYEGHVSVAVAQANNLLEDHCCIESGGYPGTVVGVFDGHGGIEAVRFAFDHLLLYFKLALMNFRGARHQDQTMDFIRKAFEDTEGGFLDLVSQRWEKEPSIATMGTCCLVGVVKLGILFVANLGNSRAVLGKMGTNGKITAQQLSNDHDVSQVAVRKEIISQHPDDPRVVVQRQGVWTVKGLEFMSISRSIGDAYLKHAKYNSERIHSRFRLAEPITKPLLTADPDIISHKLQESDRFVIFASHGLWEHLSNQEAVDIVHSHPPAGSARRLVKAALKEAARKHEMRYSDLKKIDRGVRRHFHDDITVVVLFIDSSKGQELTIRYPHTW